MLYSLVREELIKGRMNGQKRVFELSTKGEKRIDLIFGADGDLLGLVEKLIVSL